ncbi:MAG: hypothetical protein WC515_06360 [Candidatus Omnitrophota bacterium]
MAEPIPGKNRREFLRYRYEKPIHYSIVTSSKDLQPIASSVMKAVSKNLSACGILFSTKDAPDMSSVLILDLDHRTSRICQEIEENALIINNKLLGKVVRIEECSDGMRDVGVAFIKKSTDLSKDLVK